MAKDKLTPIRRAFVRAYKTNGGNATQAAIKAGYSKKTAKSQGQRLLTKVDIIEALKKEEEKMQEKYEYSIEDMLRELDEVKAKADAESNRTAQLKAIELKGKALGLFVDKVKSEVTMTQALVHFVEAESNGDDEPSIN